MAKVYLLSLLDAPFVSSIRCHSPAKTSKRGIDNSAINPFCIPMKYKQSKIHDA